MPRKQSDDEYAPCISPPFRTISCGEFGKCICDGHGRTLLLENRNGTFVEELCKVMNENDERLVEAWKFVDRIRTTRKER